MSLLLRCQLATSFIRERAGVWGLVAAGLSVCVCVRAGGCGLGTVIECYVLVCSQLGV